MEYRRELTEDEAQALAELLRPSPECMAEIRRLEHAQAVAAHNARNWLVD